MLKFFPKTPSFTPLNLTSRIIFLNVFGLGLLVCGILYLDQFRQGLIDAKMQSLAMQGRIIAAALATATDPEIENTDKRIVIDPDQLIDLPRHMIYSKTSLTHFQLKLWLFISTLLKNQPFMRR